jgi:nicotinate phosphoribosyltransferase
MVYKLVEIAGEPKIKFSEELEKTTLPGKKSVMRFYQNEDTPIFDVIMLEEELEHFKAWDQHGDEITCFEPFKFEEGF